MEDLNLIFSLWALAQSPSLGEFAGEPVSASYIFNNIHNLFKTQSTKMNGKCSLTGISQFEQIQFRLVTFHVWDDMVSGY